MDENFFITLKHFFKSHGITQAMIGDMLGVKQPFINAMLNGNKNITRSTAHKLSDAYGLSVAWLLTGEGEMMKNAKPSASVMASVNSGALNGNTATAASDLIASLVEANRQLTEQNTKLINYILGSGKPLP